MNNTFKTIATLRSKANKTLNEKELEIFQIMLGSVLGGGIPFLTSAPGIGKSATVKSIADKMGAKLIDLRVATADETHFGAFPCVDRTKELPTLEYALPGWAEDANKQFSIIFLDEINRGHQSLQNAILQMINERTVAHNFKFNDNVLMISAGNLGEEDGTEVYDMDSALLSRLIQIPFKITLSEWVSNFAKENVHPLIVEFLETNPDFYYQRKEGDKKFCCPRTWTMFSNALRVNFSEFSEEGIESWGTLEEIRRFTTTNLSNFVGVSGYSAFENFLNDREKLSKEDVISGNFTVNQVKKLPRATILDTSNQLAKEEVISNLNDLEFKNVSDFFNIVGEENADQKQNFCLISMNALSIEVIKEMLDEAIEYYKEGDISVFKNYNRYKFFKENSKKVD